MYKVITTPFDKKNYNSTNQAHYCWQKYNEYVLCVKKSDEADCRFAKNAANAICPDSWIDTWDEDRVSGKFLGIQENPVKHSH